MDLLSYKLGKKSSGGGGGGGSDIEKYISSTTEGLGTSIKDFIIKLPTLDFTGKNTMSSCFKQCSYLTEIENIINTNGVNNISFAFQQCYNLVKVPLFNVARVTSLTYAFAECRSLNNKSIDNILQMCINATKYTGTKTLAQLGFSSTYYTVERIQALPHYQDFIDAGWTIGY